MAEKLPPDGRITKFNALLPIGIKCRWCERPTVSNGIGALICILCDRPNVAMGMTAPD